MLDLVVLVAFHVLQPEVDPITSATSEYANGTAGVLSQIATCAVGIGALALAVALSPTSRAGRIGRLLLALFGAAKMVQAFFPIDAAGAEASTAGLVHNLTGNLSFFMLPVAALLLIGTLRASGRSTPVVLTWVLPAATLAVLAGEAAGVFGLAQRLYLVVAALWVAAAAASVLWPRGARSDQG